MRRNRHSRSKAHIASDRHDRRADFFLPEAQSSRLCCRLTNGPPCVMSTGEPRSRSDHDVARSRLPAHAATRPRAEDLALTSVALTFLSCQLNFPTRPQHGRPFTVGLARNTLSTHGGRPG